MPILQWYFEVEHPDSGVRFDLPPGPEPSRCEAATQEPIQKTEPREEDPSTVQQVVRKPLPTVSDEPPPTTSALEI
jgi:hypothetical protein